MIVIRVHMARALCAGGLTLALAGCATRDGATVPAVATTSVRPEGALSIDMPVQAIAANPAGKAVLDRDLPGLTTHPDYAMFKSMSLKALADLSNGKITSAALARVQTDLAALPPSP